MIDPIHSLAFSIQANPGVYALLLGSGVSRSAGMPTGWEVTLDLIRKLAHLTDANCEPNPETWYHQEFEVSPDYSDLLEALAKTPAERQQLLRQYWEPSPEERDENKKQPTAAHRAIARMVLTGSIRVVVTTNFDRLIETALIEAGVSPTVISTPDQIQGALPLIHTQCCVFKVHGDYLDARIRNTQAELDEYPSETNQLLDRILDEFGLVVCGWSASWDTALRNAILRAASRRFSTYWAFRGDLGVDAKRIIEHRRAERIVIDTADSFFETLQQSIESIDEFSRPHPLSTEIAVSTLKRYLPEQRHKIRMADLVRGVVDQVVDKISDDVLPVTAGPEVSAKTLTARVREYDAICSTLLAMATVGGAWAEDGQDSIWCDALARLSVQQATSGKVVWLDLQRYPATIVCYALCLGAVSRGHFRLVERVFSTPIEQRYKPSTTAVSALPPLCLLENTNPKFMQNLEGMDRHFLPLNDWIHDVLKPYMRELVPSNERFTYWFDFVEVLMALNHIEQTEEKWAPVGAFAYRETNLEAVVEHIGESITSDGKASPFLNSRLVGKTEEEWERNLDVLQKEVARWYQWRH